MKSISIFTALEKYDFKEDFIKWIQSQESPFIIIGETTTNYFKLERGTIQCNPISAYLFILILEIPFWFIMQNELFNGLNISEKNISIHTICRWYYIFS